MHLRAMLCACGHRLKAADEAALRGLIRAHLSHVHPQLPLLNDERAHRVVVGHDYEIEHVGVYADGAGPDKEFGPEPY